MCALLLCLFSIWVFEVCVLQSKVRKEHQVCPNNTATAVHILLSSLGPNTHAGWSFSVIVWPAAPPLLFHFGGKIGEERWSYGTEQRQKNDRRRPYMSLSAGGSVKICHASLIVDEATTNAPDTWTRWRGKPSRKHKDLSLWCQWCVVFSAAHLCRSFSSLNPHMARLHCKRMGHCIKCTIAIINNCIPFAWVVILKPLTPFATLTLAWLTQGSGTHHDTNMHPGWMDSNLAFLSFFIDPKNLPSISYLIQACKCKYIISIWIKRQTNTCGTVSSDVSLW